MARILAEDSPFEMAYKIFNDFDILQSCTITGWVMTDKAEAKGDLVLEEIRRLDQLQNQFTGADKRLRRKRVIEPDSIGGYVAQKIFKWKRTMLDNEPRITIWRFQ